MMFLAGKCFCRMYPLQSREKDVLAVGLYIERATTLSDTAKKKLKRTSLIFHVTNINV